MDAQKALEIELAWAEHLGPSRSRAHRNRALRERLSAEQNHRCCYCGVRTNEAKTPMEAPTLEHVVPRAMGGRDTYENTVLACYRCNNGRGSGFGAAHFALAEALR